MEEKKTSPRVETSAVGDTASKEEAIKKEAIKKLTEFMGSTGFLICLSKLYDSGEDIERIEHYTVLGKGFRIADVSVAFEEYRKLIGKSIETQKQLDMALAKEKTNKDTPKA